MILEQVTRRALEGKVDVLQERLKRTPIVPDHSLVLFDPILDVFVDVFVEGRRRTKGERQVNDAGGSGVSLSLKDLWCHSCFLQILFLGFR